MDLTRACFLAMKVDATPGWYVEAVSRFVGDHYAVIAYERKPDSERYLLAEPEEWEQAQMNTRKAASQ